MKKDDQDLIIELLDETEADVSNAREEQKTEAAKALEAYERRMEAEEAKRKQEEAEIYRLLSDADREPADERELLEEDLMEEIEEEETLIDEALENDIKDAIEEEEITSIEETEPASKLQPPVENQTIVIPDTVTDKTVIREAVTPKTITEAPKEAEKEAVIEESERVAVDEKKPVFITEKGRLPLSIAVETDGGVVSRIAQVGDLLPVKTVREFSTESPGVRRVNLNIYAGERPLVDQNRLIAKTKFKGIDRLPEGRAVITVEFQIDKDCNITIDAIDEGSLRRFSQTIDGSWKPSEEEIYKIITEAQENLKEDNRIRERSRMLQRARESLFVADSVLHSKKTKLSGSKKHDIKKKSKRLRQRMHKVSILQMTNVTEKGIYDALVSLNNELME